VDPAYVIAQASEHGVLNLVIRALSHHEGSWPDLEMRLADLRPGLVAWAARTALELGEVVRALDDAKIAYAVVKGPVLAAHAYGDLHARGFSDIDLLVGLNDVERALTTFNRANLMPQVAEAITAGAGQVPVLLPRGTSLDLHWELINDPHVRRDFAVSTAAHLGRVRHVEIAGAQVATLDATDTLLHLCSHAAVSGGHRLVWYVDLDRTIRRDRVNHAELVSRARETGLSLTADVLIMRAVQQLGTPGYEPLLRRTAPARVWRLVGLPVQRIPVSRAERGGHRGQLYFRSTRATLRASVREAGHFAMGKLRSKRTTT
jgi:hypothetical protein